MKYALGSVTTAQWTCAKHILFQFRITWNDFWISTLIYFDCRITGSI